jgi:hypothetical protein
MTGASAIAAAISPKPMQPRIRWRASDELAKTLLPCTIGILLIAHERTYVPNNCAIGLLELRAQGLAGAVKPRLHGSPAQAQCGSGGGTGVALQIAQHEHRSLLGWERCHRLDDALQFELREHCVLGGLF